MAVRSVIDIEVNDGAFKRFHELFKQYQEALKGTGTAWSSVGSSTKDSANNFELMTAALLAQNEALKETAEVGDSFAASAERSSLAWRDITASAHKVVRFVDKISLGVVKWLTFSGLLGLGGLWGLDRMAAGVGAARSNARELGANYGGVSAFRTDFGRFVNPDDFLDHVSNALADPAQRAYLGMLGMSAADLRGDTDDVAVRALGRARDLAKRTAPGMEDLVIKAYKLDQTLGLNAKTFRGLANTPNSEWVGQNKAFRADKTKFNLSDTEQSAWQKLLTSLDRAGKTIDTTFVKGLTRLTGPLSDLSKAFVDAATTLMAKGGPFDVGVAILTDGVQRLAKDLGDPKFQARIKQFVTDFEKLAVAVAHGLHTLAEWVGPDDKNTAPLPDRLSQKAEKETKPGSLWHSLWHRLDQPAILTKEDEEAAKKREVPAPADFSVAALERAQMMAESSDNPNAVSPKGAVGLYQFMPKTWEQYKPWPSASPFDPKANRFARDHYMHDLERRYNGDIAKALAAYNMGPNALDREIALYGPAWREHLRSYTTANGRHPGVETADYLDKVFSRMNAAKSNKISFYNGTGGVVQPVVNGQVHG